ncbi:MAG: ATP-binding protein [Methanocalculus sp. MSAO_Arc1]|uniref:ATP-binding protein n=1 Tax=Methanocalculus TaxID=71151 RepID=UPI000FF6439C|nr:MULTISPECIES: ATP-binding protein [unclassified Methanocalculus]MCP1662542.1 DNA helicase HerA-like ATPase [Methanocalculus sp. AMF5]RQD80086.1 MAG: ATP-binding protein [Methanocalculus sp. MSAO_Arc1]
MTNLIDTNTPDAAKFRLIGQTHASYRCAVPYTSEIFLGDLLAIIDEEKQFTFYAKVTGIQHSSNFADANWDTRPHTTHFYNLGEDVFLMLEATPLGYLDAAGNFRRPKTVPTKFSHVRIAREDDFAFLDAYMGTIGVGLVRNGTGTVRTANVGLHPHDLNQHMGVFATTGMGKSNFMKVFSASCMKEQPFGLLMVDPHGEYLKGRPSPDGSQNPGLLHYKDGADGLAVFSTRDEKTILRYGASTLSIAYDDFRPADLYPIFEFTEPQVEILETIGDITGSEMIDFFQETDFTEDWHKKYTGSNPGLARRLKEFHELSLRSVKRKLEILTRQNSFFRRSGSSVNAIRAALSDRKVVLIDIPGMREQSELFILSLLTRIFLNERRNSGFGSDDQHQSGQVLIAIEEAQRVLGPGRGTAVFRECAMEGRKFGIGLCVITQQPKNIDPRILAQINTYVVLGLSDRGDRQMIASSAKQDLSPLDGEIQTLERGEAVISTLSVPFPISCRIHPFDRYIKEPSMKKNDSLRKGLEKSF